MGIVQGKNLSSQSHIAADHSISLDSLSFAGLVSMQDQQPKLPPSKQVSKQDPEFEFTSTKPYLNTESAANPIKITPADVLISNGKLRPQAVAFQTNQSLITNPPTSLGSLLAATDHSSSKRSSRQTGRTRQYDRESKHTTNKGSRRAVTSTWFGHKMLKSFLSPCRTRESQVIKPGAVKAQNIPGENFIIY